MKPSTVQFLLTVLAFLTVVVTIIGAALAADRLDERLRAMTDVELEEESWWELQDGHYPNPFSRELERRAAVAARADEVAA